MTLDNLFEISSIHYAILWALFVVSLAAAVVDSIHEVSPTNPIRKGSWIIPGAILSIGVLWILTLNYHGYAIHEWILPLLVSVMAIGMPEVAARRMQWGCLLVAVLASLSFGEIISERYANRPSVVKSHIAREQALLKKAQTQANLQENQPLEPSQVAKESRIATQDVIRYPEPLWRTRVSQLYRMVPYRVTVEQITSQQPTEFRLIKTPRD